MCSLSVCVVGGDHTTLKAPVLVRSPQLSNVRHGQYLHGWPAGNTGCRRLLTTKQPITHIHNHHHPNTQTHSISISSLNNNNNNNNHLYYYLSYHYNIHQSHRPNLHPLPLYTLFPFTSIHYYAHTLSHKHLINSTIITIQHTVSLFLLTSTHLTSPHITSHHITSPHITSHHLYTIQPDHMKHIQPHTVSINTTNQSYGGQSNISIHQSHTVTISRAHPQPDTRTNT